MLSPVHPLDLATSRVQGEEVQPGAYTLAVKRLIFKEINLQRMTINNKVHQRRDEPMLAMRKEMLGAGDRSLTQWVSFYLGTPYPISKCLGLILNGKIRRKGKEFNSR